MAGARANKLIPSLTDLVGLLVGLAFLLVVPSLSGDPGTGWHLRAGSLVSENLSGLTGAGISEDRFLYPGTARNWVNNQWLSDLFLFNIQDNLGWSGLNSLVAACVFLIYFIIVLGSFRRLSISPLISAGILFLSLFMGAIQWIVRPVLFSFLFFAIVCHLLLLQKRERISEKKLLVLPLFFGLWCNLHPAFILGIALLILAIVSCLASRLLEGNALKESAFTTYFAVLVLSVLATFLSPFGLGLWQNIFGLAGNEFFMNLNAEWLSPDFHLFDFLFFQISFLLGVSLLISGYGKELNFFECGLLLLFSTASLMQRRYIPFYSIACAVPLALMTQNWWAVRREKSSELARAFQSIEQKNVLRSSVRWTSICFLSVFIVHNFFASDSRFTPDMLPKKILAVLKAEPDKARIFHSPDFGGAFAFQLWPQQLASIDDRNQLNGQQAYVDFLDIIQAASGWETKLRAGNYDWLLIDKRSPFFKLISQVSVQKRVGFRASVEDGNQQLFEQFSNWDDY